MTWGKLTPVGEALASLAGAGLVEQVPRFGTIVHIGQFNREIVELYEVREGLEPHAVGLAVGRITPAEIERLKSSAIGSTVFWPI